MTGRKGAMQEMIIDVIKYEHTKSRVRIPGKNIVEMSGIVRNFIASVVHKIQGTLPRGIYGLWTLFKHQSDDALTD